MSRMLVLGAVMALLAFSYVPAEGEVLLLHLLLLACTQQRS